MTETTQRILNLQAKRHVNDHQLELGAGLAVSSIQSWTKGKNGKIMNPSTEAIIKLARYFNVSADYLLCLSDEPTPLKTANIAECPTAALSTELADLAKDERFVDSAKLYNAIPLEYRAEIYGYIRGIATSLGLNIQQILGR